MLIQDTSGGNATRQRLISCDGVLRAGAGQPGIEDRAQMQAAELVNLSPGMAVTVEIKTGSRRIISYLLSPVLKYKQEILREK